MSWWEGGRSGRRASRLSPVHPKRRIVALERLKNHPAGYLHFRPEEAYFHLLLRSESKFGHIFKSLKKLLKSNFNTIFCNAKNLLRAVESTYKTRKTIHHD